MLFRPARRGFSYLNKTLSFCYMCSAQRFVALYKAILWVRILKGYLKNPVSNEECLSVIRMLMHWRRKCGLDDRNFVKATQELGRGHKVPYILRTLAKPR